MIDDSDIENPAAFTGFAALVKKMGPGFDQQAFPTPDLL